MNMRKPAFLTGSRDPSHERQVFFSTLLVVAFEGMRSLQTALGANLNSEKCGLVCRVIYAS